MRPSSEDLYRDSYVGGRAARGKGFKLGLQLGGLLVLVLLLFGVGDYLQRYFQYKSAREIGRVFDPSLPDVSLLEPLRSIALNSLAYLPRPSAERGLLESGLPVYDLRLARKELRTLQQTAERVMAQSVSTGIERKYVPAEFLIDGTWEPIQVKLRGLYAQHYIKTRPSLRLKFPSRKLFRGTRQINLIDPYDKGLTVDVTTGWELERRGLLQWDSRFVVLRMNDDVVGVFQEIEQFGRSMTDRGGRPEGPIFSGYGQAFGKSGGPIHDKAAAVLARVQGCLQAPDSRFQEAIAPAADAAQNTCDWDFLREHFQVDKWAWAAAMRHFLHSSHAWHPDNLRVFWDPARGQFEPIAWDYGAVGIDLEVVPDAESHASGYARFFLDAPEFRRMRDTRTWTLLHESVEPMVEHAQELFESVSPALRLDPRHPDFSLDEARQAHYIGVLRHNRQQLESLYETHALTARTYAPSQGQVVVALENHGTSFIEVEGLTFESVQGRRHESLASARIVDGIWEGAPGTLLLRAAAAPDEQLVAIDVRNGVTGVKFSRGQIRLEGISGKPPLEPAPSQPTGLDVDPVKELASEAANVHFDGNTLRFGPGRVLLPSRLETPADVDVHFEAGLELAMAPGAALMIYGDLSSLGSQAQPIRIFASDPAQEWGGIFVQGTQLRKSRVHLRHTHIRGGLGGENERTFFTSAFAVHDAVVVLENCEFVDGKADDGINLKYAEVTLTGNLLRGSKDDALDCDFCVGELRGNVVRDSGGDGFDFSGSDVLVTESLVDGCADKGMSIGERTMARVFDNEVRDCATGVAVKDLSEVEIDNLRLSRLKVGVAAYIKKPSFGPSRVRVSGLQMNEVATDFVRDAACKIEHGPVSASSAK